MPLNDGPAKRTLAPDERFHPNPPAPFVELGMASAFSFLRGASEPMDLAATANLLGYDRVGLADRNSLAGAVRMMVEGRTAHVDALIGCRLALTCGAELLAYPQDRAAYGRLSSLLSRGKMETPEGKWQAKDVTEITLPMLAGHAEGLHLIALPKPDLHAFEGDLARLAAALPGMGYLAASHLHRGDDRARINRLDALAGRHGLRLLATNDVLYHVPSRRPLQDVLTCIRHGVTVDGAGLLLEANAERHLKPPEEMVRLFGEWPHAIRATRELADRIGFRLDQLRQDYPHEPVPPGKTPQEHLEDLTWEGAAERYPQGVPGKVAKAIEKEFELIRARGIAGYFLTIHDVIRFARTRPVPILCQGRGSAANSAVCYCLGITAVDPDEHRLLFERFLSAERNEPPDIDVDFEHERREEVIQYIYGKYGRRRAGLVATVIHYRPRSAIREVGKALGLTEDVTAKLAGTIWGHFEGQVGDDRVAEAGLDMSDRRLTLCVKLARELIGLPRHLSQHVGGFVMTNAPLTELVPVGNGAMPERSFIEWDKDDVDAMGFYKMDVLALGMLTCMAKGFDLIAAHGGPRHELHTIPKDDARTYDMLCRGESLGVFQVESRAQMAMLPKLRPRCFYDLVIEVAIVRPGPIQGDMVHPYLKRRSGIGTIEYPRPGPGHDPMELENILGRTLGVPIFQEQAMEIAMVAAEFTPAEANQLRKAMATFRDKGVKVSSYKERMVERMVARGYERAFAARCFSQIEGFGEYGFPESHAASFAKLVYVSSWMKCHFPDAFAAALLNSQPMGFYAPAQIVRDARENGVKVRPADVSCSEWDCTLEPAKDDGPRRVDAASRAGGDGTAAPSPPAAGWTRSVEDGGAPEPSVPRAWGPRAGMMMHALRLGLRQIDGFGEEDARRISRARAEGPFRDATDLRARAGLDARAMRLLAEADALASLGRARREALWDVNALGDRRALPAFDAAHARSEGPDRPVALPPMPSSEEVVADYQTTRLSLRRHPMSFFRASLARQGYVPARALGREVGHGRRAKAAGLVLVRQKPGSAKGVCFVTLEDETGVINLVIWPDRFALWRGRIMSARLMAVEGTVQSDGRVTHLVAEALYDRSDRLAALSNEDMRAVTVRGDHPTKPIPHQVDAMAQVPRTHPREARVIPKSRDFH
ncbi:DnaE-like error-prone DNA polymerase [Hasllibacter halocynthiae]|uniref:Error-prone DNA polymerase n=1 Tax=Hasllibacter halocynthiae TaxID=595589 RepID=A0A2T0X6W7_9RHOB|nr:error-prone DNA polymerase [Hasllibacter halocynthiae]PRY94635.1 DnaE-like error-prone DNA polymerase [Hasllibacter halocynthiae]